MTFLSFHAQVNESPCFQIDSVMDKEIKEGLLFDALNLLNFTTCTRGGHLEDQVRPEMKTKNTEYVNEKSVYTINTDHMFLRLF